jgi:ABC-type proline/glycine betaine transport system permease subunit
MLASKPATVENIRRRDHVSGNDQGVVMKYVLWGTKVLGMLVLIVVVIALAIVALTGMPLGVWVAMHWDLSASGSGGLFELGGFVAQVAAVGLLVAIVCFLEDLPYSPV